MRFAASFALALLAATALPLPGHAQTATPAPAGLAIVEFVSDPATGGREFVELLNAGNATLQLQGHQVKDAGTNTFTFPAWSLPPGGRVVVWGGGAADALGPAWSQSAAWNNAGDTIRLLAPDGSPIEELAYGPAPATLAAPAKGKSWALDGTWTQGDPTPGAAPGADAHPFTAIVANAPPSGAIEAPATGTPGAVIAVTVRPSDPNGAEDVASWTLTSGTQELASGASGAAATAQATLPASGAFPLKLTVTDRAGLSGEATAEVRVAAGLVVEMPSGPLSFPPFLPGAAGVAASAPFTLRNGDAAPRTPLLDVSDLRGPGGTLPMAGHLEAGVTLGNATTWVPYRGPLTPLPALAPGATATVLLRYKDVPAPLAAGSYGASFTVVA